MKYNATFRPCDVDTMPLAKMPVRLSSGSRSVLSTFIPVSSLCSTSPCAACRISSSRAGLMRHLDAMRSGELGGCYGRDPAAGSLPVRLSLPVFAPERSPPIWMPICFHNRNRVARTVEEIRIAERDVCGAGGYLPADVLQHDVPLHDAERAPVNRNHRPPPDNG